MTDWGSFDSQNPPGGATAAHLTALVDGGETSLHSHPGAQIDGVTASAAEINTLDGITSTTAELNTLHSSGVTNADLIKVHALTPTAAEVNTLASSGVTNADLIKLHAVTAAAATLNQVAAAAGTVTYDRSVKVVKVALAALDSGGGVFAWANPEAGSIIVTRVVLDVTTKASAACTLDIGTTASNATTLSDNLIDGADVGTGTVTTDSVRDAGTNGKSVQRLATGKWVTGSMASGAAAGLAGSAYISYLNV